MYRKYWNLDRKPFSTAFEADLIHYREPFANAFHSVSLASRMAPAVLWLTGAAGTGKSTLLLTVEDSLDDSTNLVHVSGKYVEDRSLLRDMLEKNPAFHGLSAEGNIEQRLSSYFSVRDNQDRSILLAVDDADLIRNDDVITEIRNAQNMGMKRGWPLTVLLTGTSIPALLHPEDTSSLTIIDLKKPGRNECGEIIEHRLSVSGAQRQIFTPSAMEHIVSLADGNIRTLLTIAEMSLQVGSVARVQAIDDELVRNRVEPMIEKFLRNRKDGRELAPNAVKTETDGSSTPADTDVKSSAGSAQEASRLSPWSMGRQRLVSQAELESYISSSTQDEQQRTARRLKEMIETGKLNVAESLSMRSKSESEAAREAIKEKEAPKEDSKETGVETEEETGIAAMEPSDLYIAGLELLRGVLKQLRNKEFTDVEPVLNLAEAIVTTVDSDPTLFNMVLDEQDSTVLHTHLLNVGILTAVVSGELGLKKENRIELCQIGLLHDVGHLHCGEDLLLSENRFDRSDFRAIKQHPLVGRDLIKKYTNGSKLMAVVIAQEHERDDGLGYPNYLGGKEIHLYAKIIALCDVFEALSHNRAHRRALTPEETLVNINATMARRTDRRLIRALQRAVLQAMAA